MLVVFVDINPSKFPIVRFLMALSAAFFALFFVGGVLLEGTLRGLYISATGGFVLFILIQFVFNPWEVLPSSNIFKAENTNLSQNGIKNSSPTPVPSPTSSPSTILKIFSPKNNEAVLAHGNKKGDAYVGVNGAVENAPAGEGLRVYVFYQSADLDAGGWWYYKYSEIDQKGEWLVPHVYLGGEKPVLAGNRYRIQVIVANADLRDTLEHLPTDKPVPDLSVFHPLASVIVNITISVVTVDSSVRS